MEGALAASALCGALCDIGSVLAFYPCSFPSAKTDCNWGSVLKQTCWGASWTWRCFARLLDLTLLYLIKLQRMHAVLTSGVSGAVKPQELLLVQASKIFSIQHLWVCVCCSVTKALNHDCRCCACAYLTTGALAPVSYGRSGRTPLMEAALHNNTCVLRTILSDSSIKDAQLERACNKGRTALCYAAWGASTDAMRLLLNNRACPEHKDL